MGGAGTDVFVLGTPAITYYDDYAQIEGFDAGEDVIELSDSQTYYFDIKPIGTLSGTGI